jgi:uncharacterized protein (TIGR03437 family)
MNRLRTAFLEQRATVLLLVLLAVFLFSGQSSNCRYPIIQSAEVCCDCDSLTTCPPGGSVITVPTGTSAPGAKINFEANAGQADARFPFVARGGGMSLFLSEGGEVALDLGDGVVKASLAGGNTHAAAEAEQPLSGRINYFLGSDPSKWVRDVPTFGRIRYRGVYPGIDLIYYGAQGRLEHDFIVAPGADPRLIRMRLNGVDSMEVDGQGDAVLHVGTKSVAWKKPLLYQSVAGLRRRVEGRYRVESKSELGFEVGVYDPLRPLIIDPVVIYSTYIGRGGNETASRLAVDNNGNVYMTGVSAENSYPTTPGTGGLTPAAARGNIVVTKLNANATELVYSTILGGGGIDLGLGIAVDPQGAVYLTGATTSEDFPTTAGVVQRTYGKPGGEYASTPALGDCFITRLGSAGNSLSFSTYLGGTVLDGCSSIALDSAGNIFVTGGTNSANFPSTDGSFQRAFRGGSGTYPALKSGDAFVAKLNNNATQLLYATFIGGNGEEAGSSIAVDGDGNAYITGFTNSTFGFPLTATAPQTRYAGSGGNVGVGLGDAFIVKLDPTGSKQIYGTLLGGARDEVAFGIAVDKQGAAYITGSTLSTDFPVSAVARQGNYRGQSVTAGWYAGDAFVAKLNPAGTAWEYSTYLGGTADDRGTGIVVADDGSAWVLGHTLSSDYWVTEDATQRRYSGDRQTEFYASGDVFLTHVGPTGGTLLFSTYLGGQGNDWALGLAADAQGAIYVAGGTSSPDFPTTPGVYQRAFGTAQGLFLPLGDVFVAKFGDAQQPGPNVTIAATASAASYDGSAISPGEIVVITGTALGPAQLISASPSGGLFPTALSQTRVLIGGKAAPLLYASERQTSAIVPWDAIGPNAEIVVEYQGVRSRALMLPVVASLPGLFSANASGRGQAAALNQDFSLNTAATPADPGSIVVLYGTGEGRTLPASVDGKIAEAPLPRPELPVNVTIAGQRAEVLYAGAAPGLVAGAFQLNVRLPVAIAQGNQPVTVQIGARTSQTGLTIAVR